MKRFLIAGGSIGAVVFLVLAMFPTVVSSNIVKEYGINPSFFFKSNRCKVREFIEKLKESWIPGSILILLVFLLSLLSTIWSIILRALWYWSRS